MSTVMRVTGGALVALALLGAGCACPSRKEALAERWLYRTCSQTGQMELEAEIRRNAGALEPVFIAAYENGPSQKAEEAAARAVDREIELIKSFIKNEGALAANEIGHEQAQRLLTLTLNPGMRRERARRRFREHYRAAAVSGLGLTGGEAAMRILEGLSKSVDSPYQHAAQLSLARRSGKFK